MLNNISKSTTLLCLFIISLCLFGYYLVDKITSPELTIENQEIIDDGTYDNYDWNKLSGETIKTYEDDNYTSMFGIDVAAHQDYIDWKKVKEDGVQFAYIRLGYRGALEGKLNIDEQFENNYKNAKAAGLKVGVYWYSQPVSELEAIAEADFVYEVLNGREIDLPIGYDFEETMFAYEYSRMHGMSKNDCTAMAIAFCTQMKSYGYDSILYSNMYWADNNYNWDILDDYLVWYAQYDCEYPEFDRPLVMWQYSDNSYINGINRNCDLNIMFVKKNG